MPCRKSIAVVAFAVFCAVAAVPLLAQDANSIIAVLTAEKRGNITPIVDEKGAMNAFYGSLSRTAAKKAGAITRVAHYGDSLIEMDLLSGDVRRRLQKSFGDAGHGFIHVANTKTWYHHLDVTHKPGAEWIAYQLNDNKTPTRKFGLGGAFSMVYKPGAESGIGTGRGPFGKAVSSFEILTLQEPEGGAVEVRIDGKKTGSFSTKSQSPADGFVKIAVPQGEHQMTLVGQAVGTKLLGVILETGGPGVVYDALGVNGIGAAGVLRSDREHWKAQLAHRDPDLIVLGFGTNDATEPNLNISDFKLGLKQVVGIVKQALPNSSILLMAPLDRAMKQGAGWATMPNIPKIVAAEREVAAELGVAYWSAYDAMGGEGSMARWYKANPRLCSGDFMHPTPEGAKVMGDLWYDALMDGFMKYLQAKGVASQARIVTPNTLTEIKLQ